MEVFYTICEWLLVIALVGFIGAVAWMAVSALSLKNGLMKNAKRLYEPPLNSTKTLIATGKGIAQQETVRAKHIGGSVKVAAHAVKGAAGEIKVAAEGIHPEELKTAFGGAQNVLKVAAMVAKLAKAGPKQGVAH